MFQIETSNQSKNFLKKCDKILYQRIIDKIELLKTEPVPHDSKRVVGEKRCFRVQIGDYRILYDIIWEKRVILIAKIDKRSKVYD
jgi:mRNA interferase RelE/StbE